MPPQTGILRSILCEGDGRRPHDFFVVFDGKGFETPGRFSKDQRWLQATRPQLETQFPAGAAS